MKASLLLLPLAIGLLLAAPAAAQRGVYVGPTLGGTLATTAYDEAPDYTSSPLRAGFVAGATGRYQTAGHWGAQVAALFVQQGYSQHYEDIYYQYVDRVRFAYLRLPLLATFSSRAGGQGWQLLAGPYLGVLLGGNRTYEAHGTSQDASVLVADTYTRPAFGPLSANQYTPDYTLYARRFDVGLQGGVGYRAGNALLQVSYTLGLRNQAATTVYTSGATATRSVNIPYRTRSLDASFTYLFGAR